MIKFFKLVFFFLLLLNIASCKKVIKISDNFIEDTALSKSAKEISKEATEKSAKNLSNSYVGKSVGHQAIRKAVREKVEKEMEKEGVNSFFQYGTLKASKELSNISIPSSKKKMLDKFSNHHYDEAIAKYRKDGRVTQSSHNKEKATKKATKNTGEIIAKYEGKQMMDYLATHNPETKKLIEELLKRNKPNPNTTLDKFYMQIKDDGKIILYHKEWEKSTIEIDKNIVRAKAGCRAKSIDSNQAYNEFLSVSMPNKKYILDDIYEIETDNYGRVKHTSCVMDKNKITLRSGRVSNYQKEIVTTLNGKEGDQGGHLIQNALGGPNELINQVPMNREINQKGIWRAIEIYEVDQCWNKGKTIISKRIPIYEGNSKRPKAFIVDVIIDGKHAIIKGQQCPITISNP